MILETIMLAAVGVYIWSTREKPIEFVELRSKHREEPLVLHEEEE